MANVHKVIHLYRVYYLNGLCLEGPACTGSPFISNVRCVILNDKDKIDCPHCKKIVNKELTIKSDNL